jgi:hypothetical protein
MAKPKLALIPAAQGTSLYSVLPSSGVGDFSFTRSGSATRISAQGLIETVDSGVSRLNYPLIDGVVKGCPHHILEPSSTNLVTYSEQFDNSIWVKSNTNITANQTISPDGTLNADLLNSSSGLSTHSVRNDTSQTATVGQNITLSVFAKKGTHSIIQLTAFAFGSIYANFDLENGIVGSYSSTNASIKNYGNGWYRCSFTNIAIGTTNSEIQINIAENLQSIRNASFNALGNETLYLWGATTEQNSYPTSYIPTTTSAVTRSAETANGAGSAATFNDSEGVLMAEISALANDGIRVITLSNGSNAERILLSYNQNGRLDVNIIENDSYQAVFNYTNINSIEFNKILISYKQNDFKLWLNGFQVGSVENGNTPVGLNTLNFGATYNASVESFYGNTKQLQYFDTALTNSELEQLTSWVSFQEMAEGQLYTIE